MTQRIGQFLQSIPKDVRKTCVHPDGVEYDVRLDYEIEWSGSQHYVEEHLSATRDEGMRGHTMKMGGLSGIPTHCMELSLYYCTITDYWCYSKKKVPNRDCVYYLPLYDQIKGNN